MREALRRAASNHWDEMTPEQANSAWWRYQSNAGCFDPRMFETHWFDKFCAYDCLCKFRWRKEFSCWNSDRKIRSWKAVQEVSPVLRAAAEAEKTALGPRWSAVPWNIGMVVNFSDSSNSGCVWNSAGFCHFFFVFRRWRSPSQQENLWKIPGLWAFNLGHDWLSVWVWESHVAYTNNAWECKVFWIESQFKRAQFPPKTDFFGRCQSWTWHCSYFVAAIFSFLIPFVGSWRPRRMAKQPWYMPFFWPLGHVTNALKLSVSETLEPLEAGHASMICISEVEISFAPWKNTAWEITWECWGTLFSRLRLIWTSLVIWPLW